MSFAVEGLRPRRRWLLRFGCRTGSQLELDHCALNPGVCRIRDSLQRDKLVTYSLVAVSLFGKQALSLNRLLRCFGDRNSGVETCEVMQLYEVADGISRTWEVLVFDCSVNW